MPDDTTSMGPCSPRRRSQRTCKCPNPAFLQRPNSFSNQIGRLESEVYQLKKDKLDLETSVRSSFLLSTDRVFDALQAHRLNQTITHYEHEKAGLEASVRNAMETLDAWKETVKGLEEQLSDQEDDESKAQAQALQNRVTELEARPMHPDNSAQIQSLEKEICELRAQRDRDQTQATSLTASIRDLETERQLRNEEQDKLNDTITELKTANLVLQTDAHHLQGEVEQLNASCIEKDQELKSKDMDLVSCRDQVTELQVNETRHLDQMKALSDLSDDYKLKLAALKDEKRQLQLGLERVQALDQSKAELERQLAATKEELVNLNTLNLELETRQIQIEQDVQCRLESVQHELKKEWENEYKRKAQEVDEVFSQRQRVAIEVDRRLALEPVIEFAMSQLQDAILRVEQKQTKMAEQYAEREEALLQYIAEANTALEAAAARNDSSGIEEMQGVEKTVPDHSTQSGQAYPLNATQPASIPSQGASSSAPGGQTPSETGRRADPIPSSSQNRSSLPNARQRPDPAPSQNQTSNGPFTFTPHPQNHHAQSNGQSTTPGSGSIPDPAPPQNQTTNGQFASTPHPQSRHAQSNGQSTTPGSGAIPDPAPPQNQTTNGQFTSTPHQQRRYAQSNGRSTTPGSGLPYSIPAQPKAKRTPGMAAARRSKTKRPLEQEAALNAFREFVQAQLGIKKDRDIDILVVNRATSDKLEAFEQNTGRPTPNEKGIYPLDLEGDITVSEWNQEVGELLIGAFLEKRAAREGGGEDEDGVDESLLRPLWSDRLKSIKRAQKHVALALLDDNHLEVVSMDSRRITNRNQLLARRQRSSQLAWSPEVRQLFAVLFSVLNGPAMSSDEEIGLERRKKTCKVIRKDWQHEVLINLLKWLDYNADRNQLTASGVSPGPPPRPRIRLVVGRDTQGSSTPVVSKLPRNLYSPAYLGGLTQLQLAQLDPQPAITLPIEVLNLQTNEEFDVNTDDKDEYWRPPPRDARAYM
ncbi:hypothetical protein DFH06DRAFT_1119478 [Mycena polygramma]|nr:hypothetical protein DFH06DRAFT_1119478 [Mycena polygramma]